MRHISFDFGKNSNCGKIEHELKFMYLEKKLKVLDLKGMSGIVGVFKCIFTEKN